MVTYYCKSYYRVCFRLWFDEIMGIWLTATNTTRWEEVCYYKYSKYTVGPPIDFWLMIDNFILIMICIMIMM